MARLKDLAAGVSDLFKIDPRIIKVMPGFNVRHENADLAEHVASLKQSIEAVGVKTPLKVRLVNDEIFVVDGHCRLKAIMELIGDGVEIETVPCVPEGKYSTDAERDLELLTSNSGKPLTPLEKADVFKRLLSHGWDRSQIAKKAGLSEKQVSNMLDLSVAPTEVREMISSGAVSATTAMRTIQSEGADKAAETLKEAVKEAKENGKSKVTPKAVKAVTATKKTPSRPPAPVEDEEDEKPKFGAAARVAAPAPASPPTVQMPVMTPKRFREFVETMHAIVASNDLKAIHAMARDCLKSKG